MDTKIGDSVWLFDINRRVYVDDQGNRTSVPVWLHHWHECKIVGETSRSWILNYFNKKVPKKDADNRQVCFCWEQVLGYAWVHNNRSKIELAIRGLSLEKLREVAAVIDYKGE